MGVKAQVSFFTYYDFLIGLQPTCLASGDFNGDGIKDIAATLVITNELSIFLGDGTGSFTGPTNYTVGYHQAGIVSADFNEDGKLDLATADRDNYRITVLLGDGTGSFSVDSSYILSGNPWSIVSVDLNGDGHKDLVTGYNEASWGPDSLAVLLGNGTGNFSKPVCYTISSQTRSIASADFNNDGKADMATVGLNTSDVCILLGDGAGGFAQMINYPVCKTPYAVTIADFNSDGKMDFAVCKYDTVEVLFGNGLGNFSNPVYLHTGPLTKAILSADFNGDGNMDIATTNTNNYTVSVFTGDGAGHFSTAYSFLVGYTPGDIIHDDFNGDGKMDMATANPYSNNFSVLINSTNPTALPDIKMGQTSVYPDPCTGTIIIELPAGVNDAEINIFSSLGAMVYKQAHAADCNTIDLSKEVKGVYMVNIISKGSLIASKKLVKE